MFFVLYFILYWYFTY